MIPHGRVVGLVVLTAIAVHATAQCEGRWLGGPEFARAGLPSSVEFIRAVTRWDPDGPGPESTRLVVGGVKPGAALTAGFVATWDGSEFSPLPVPPDVYDVSALAVFNGEIIAANRYSSSLWAWNGSAWRVIGTPQGPVFAMTVAHGHLYIGGGFTAVGTVQATGVARWNGVAWSGVGGGLGAGNSVVSLITASNGDVVAGGVNFGVRRYNGTAWTTLAGSVNTRVRSLLELPGGDIVAGGWFTSIQGVPAANIARWNGVTWQAMGAGTSAPVWDMEWYEDRLIASTSMRPVPGGHAFQISAWTLANGWTPLDHELLSRPSNPLGDDYGPLAMCVHDGRLVVVGGFDAAGPVLGARMAIMESDHWVRYADGFDGDITEFIAVDGSMIAVGSFTQAPGGVTASRVAQWDGATWSPLGDGLNGRIVDADLFGDQLMVSGDFDASGSKPTGRVARWNGGGWEAFGDRNPAVGGKIAAAGNDVFVLAGPTLYRWNQAANSWDVQPPPQIDQFAPTQLHTVIAHAGLLYAGGSYDYEGGPIKHGVLLRLNTGGWQVLRDFYYTMFGTSESTVERVWSVPGHGVVYSGRGWYAIGSVWDAGGGFPLPSLANTESSFVPPRLNAFASFGPARTVINGLFNYEQGQQAIALNSMVHVADGAAFPMGDGRAIGSALALFRGEAVFNATDAAPNADLHRAWSRWTFDNAPWIARISPDIAAVACHQVATFTTTPASGYDPVTFRWQVEDPADGWRDLADGSLTFGGSTVAAVSGAQSASLATTPVTGFGTAHFRCVISHACGSATSDAVTLTVTTCPRPCDGDVNCDFARDGIDVETQERAVGGDVTDYCQPDPDFNGDFALDGFDVEAVERVVGGGPCP